MKNIICFLSNPKNQQEFIDSLKAFSPDTKVAFIAQTDDRGTADALQNIQDSIGQVDAMLYLWALEDHNCIQDVSALVSIFQTIARIKSKPGKFMLAGQFDNSLDRCYLESWMGFERSLGMTLPHTSVAVVYRESGGEEKLIQDWMPILWAELHMPQPQTVLYQKGKRFVHKIKPIKFQTSSIASLRSGGTYLIT
ncbi:MAG: hypothetical protein HOL31_01465, partial [Candidatus Scalindua sp.]|nr:hypothetical protein [Candidatus Scalindua sp.]